MTLPSLRSSLILARTILSPVVFQDELSSVLRSSSPRGLGCIEDITRDIVSLAESVSTGTVRCGFPSAVNSTIREIPICCSRVDDVVEEFWTTRTNVADGPGYFS